MLMRRGACRPRRAIPIAHGDPAAHRGTMVRSLMTLPWLAVVAVGCGSSDADAPVDTSDVGGSDGAVTIDSERPSTDGGVDALADGPRDASADAARDSSSDAASDAPSGAGAAAALLGVYCGNDPADVTQFETWLGRNVDGILGYTGSADWTDYDGSVGWAKGVWSALDRRVLWSVPLIPKGATLEDAASGKYDSHYTAAAKQLATFRPSEKVLYVRTAWEFNGDWFPWAAKGKEAAFIGAFQHFVKAFRAESTRFVIEWNVNVGDVGMNPETAYPGDAYVDIIGMDFYWNTDWDPKDPEAAWTSMRDRTYGLKWHQAFAATHGKPTAYSEWGIRSDAAAAYIAHAKDWFDTHPVLYQTYWNSNSAFPGQLSKDQYPAAGAKYKALFAK